MKSVLPQVADQPAIEVKQPEDTKPIQFRKIVVKLKRGQDIGSVQVGPFCLKADDFLWGAGREAMDGAELTGIFQDELTAANYRVVGDPDALFDDSSAWAAEYLVAGLVTSMQANVCYPFSGKNDFVRNRAEVFMDVEWQVYGRLDQKVVHQMKSQGSGIIKKARPEGANEAFLLAFAQASRNMLADQGFHDLVTGARPAVATSAPATGVSLKSPALSASPMAGHAEEVRAEVVTVLAGGGHGSGFFIDTAGHVLTNYHVVGTAERVTLRLSGGQELVAAVLARDSRRDVALLQVEQLSTKGLPLRLDAPKVGDEVFAVGAPLNVELSGTMSKGIVSALRAMDGLAFIQSDVSILGGSSGGPLLDANGNVIGIAVSGMNESGSSTSVNFFIPIGDALGALGISVESGTL